MTDIPTQEHARTVLKMENVIPAHVQNLPLIKDHLWPLLEAYAQGQLINRDDALAAIVDCEMSFNNTQRFANKFPTRKDKQAENKQTKE